MPAVSKAQKNFFALALKVKQGKVPASEVSDELAKAAKEYDEKEIKAYADTDVDGLPDKVGEKYELDEMDASATPASVNGMGDVSFPGNPGSQDSFDTQETGSGDIPATSALTDGDDDEEELKKLKAGVMSENILSFEDFVNENIHNLGEELEDARMMRGSAESLNRWAEQKIKESDPSHFVEESTINEGTDLGEWKGGGKDANKNVLITQFTGPAILDKKVKSRKCIQINVGMDYITLNMNDVDDLSQILNRYL